MANKCLPLVALFGIFSFLSCRAAIPLRQSHELKVVLALGESVSVPDTDVKVSFEEVIEDSRCPTGAVCIWAGDAAVRVRFSTPNAPPANYVLHTNSQFMQKAEHNNLRVLLVAVTPQPAADAETKRESYRVTLLIERT